MQLPLQETKCGDVFDYALKRFGGARERKKAKVEAHGDQAAILAAPLRFGVVNQASGIEVLRGWSRRDSEQCRIGENERAEEFFPGGRIPTAARLVRIDSATEAEIPFCAAKPGAESPGIAR